MSGDPEGGQEVANTSTVNTFRLQGSSVKLETFESKSSGLSKPQEVFTVRRQDSTRAREDDHIGSMFVIPERAPFRIFWSVVFAILLVYTATVYIYRFSFCLFHTGMEGYEPVGVDDPFWKGLDTGVDVLFWLDLFLNFLFTYSTDRGVEVDSIKMIAKRYLQGSFWINLIACTPESFSAYIIGLMRDDSASGLAVVGRISRLQRVSRLTRLTRLTRIANWAAMRSTSPMWTYFRSLRGVRVVNFFVGLVWSVHFLACGWYLVAALQEDEMNTWLARRVVDAQGTLLLAKGPGEQWMHSMYFVLTVFTTVGFGDMSAVTEIEIVYVCVTMIVGAVVHSIILSEVINIVTSEDRIQEFVDKQLGLIDAFAEHAQLPSDKNLQMKEAIKFRAKTWMVQCSFNKNEMRELMTGKHLPRWLIGSLPNDFFGGKLLRNQFLLCCCGTGLVPPRLPCLLAVYLQHAEFDAGEIVYQMHDFPFNVFLVMKGTFAGVGVPSANGGIDSICTPDLLQEEATVAPPQEEHIAEVPSTRRSSTSNPFGQHLSKTVNKVFKLKYLTQSGTFEGGNRAPSGLFPYRLISHGNYFGEAEIFAARPRVCTVRCEVSASCLVLHKSDFAEMKDEFPQFAQAWYQASRRRQWTRLRQLRHLTRPLPYQMRAVVSIQRFVRDSMTGRRGDTPRREPVKLHSKGVAQLTEAASHVDAFVGREDHGGASSQESKVLQVLQAMRGELLSLHSEVRMNRDEVASLKNEVQRQNGGLQDPESKASSGARAHGEIHSM